MSGYKKYPYSQLTMLTHMLSLLFGVYAIPSVFLFFVFWIDSWYFRIIVVALKFSYIPSAFHSNQNEWFTIAALNDNILKIPISCTKREAKDSLRKLWKATYLYDSSYIHNKKKTGQSQIYLGKWKGRNCTSIVQLKLFYIIATYNMLIHLCWYSLWRSVV